MKKLGNLHKTFRLKSLPVATKCLLYQVTIFCLHSIIFTCFIFTKGTTTLENCIKKILHLPVFLYTVIFI